MKKGDRVVVAKTDTDTGYRSYFGSYIKVGQLGICVDPKGIFEFDGIESVRHCTSKPGQKELHPDEAKELYEILKQVFEK